MVDNYTITEESTAVNNTELDSENDCNDDNNFNTDEPYYENSIEADGNQQCSSQSTIQESSALFFTWSKKEV